MHDYAADWETRLGPKSCNLEEVPKLMHSKKKHKKNQTGIELLQIHIETIRYVSVADCNYLAAFRATESVIMQFVNVKKSEKFELQ